MGNLLLMIRLPTSGIELNNMTTTSKILLTESQVKDIKALSYCRFLPGSFDKRFVKEIQGKESLTVWQHEQLERLIHKYRKQLGI